MNKDKLFIVLIIISFAFGQRHQDNYSSNNLFKDAVKAFNSGEYFETKYLLDNLLFSELQQYQEEIPVLKMKTEYRLNNLSESRSIGKTFLQKYPTSEYLVDIFITFGDIFTAESNFNSAYRTYFKALKEENAERYFNKIVKRIIQTLQFGISENTVDELLSFENDDAIISILLLSKVQCEIQNGTSSLARETLSAINDRNLNGISKEFYNQLIEKSGSVIRNITIPVVLPFSGKNAKIGREFLDGLNFAQSQNKVRGLNLTFAVYNNESDALKTLEIFKNLSNNDKIIAVLGPITEENSIIAGSFSDQFGIPILLPNATTDGLANLTDCTFLMNSDLSTRGVIAARFIADKLNAQNIAVLAPADKFGKNIVDAFENELKTYGLSTAIIEWYSGVPMNLERQFKAFRTKAWKLADTTNQFSDEDTSFVADRTDILNSEIDSMSAVLEEEKMTKEDSSDVVLESFDAIYMPIKNGDLEYVGAQFPAYNLKTTIVGNDNWTDLDILQKENIGSHFKGLIVISNYAHYNIDRLNAVINEKHSEYFYQAFDAYNLLVEAMNKSVDSNITLKQVLSEIDGYNGIFGTYNFSDDKNVNSSLYIVRFNGRDFEQ